MTLTREELFRRLGIAHHGPKIDKLTHKAYVDLEKRIWIGNLENSPHGHPWHTSFHASAFDNPCGRFAIYTLLDIPPTDYSSPMLRATGEQGKAAEQQIVYRWGRAGLTIGGNVPLEPDGKIYQLGFADEETWLTGSIDSVLGIEDWPNVLPVDIKSKPKEVIDKMNRGILNYFPEHYGQVQAYIYLCFKFYSEMGWKEMGFGLPKGAILYYVSRENPRHTHEFYIEADWPYINTGILKLKSWKRDFINGILPERPKEWKWTESPCKWCRFKKFACKPDIKDGVVSIHDTNATNFAGKMRTNYDQLETIRGVLNRWT